MCDGSKLVEYRKSIMSSYDAAGAAWCDLISNVISEQVSSY